MKWRRRILSLIVHPRDITQSADTSRAVNLAIATGALDIVQLRSTEDDTDGDIASAMELRAFETPNTSLVLNHPSLDLAIAVHAHGWHLKESLLTAHAQGDLMDRIRQARDHKMITGCSVHGVDTALTAAQCGVDYIQVGTMFPTLSHPDKMVLEGPQLLSDVRRALQKQFPSSAPRVIGVGGISSDSHVQQLLSSGGDGVAVIRGISAAKDPSAAALAFRSWLDQVAIDHTVV